MHELWHWSYSHSSSIILFITKLILSWTKYRQMCVSTPYPILLYIEYLWFYICCSLKGGNPSGAHDFRNMIISITYSRGNCKSFQIFCREYPKLLRVWNRRSYSTYHNYLFLQISFYITYVQKSLLYEILKLHNIHHFMNVGRLQQYFFIFLHTWQTIPTTRLHRERGDLKNPWIQNLLLPAVSIVREHIFTYRSSRKPGYIFLIVASKHISR